MATEKAEPSMSPSLEGKNKDRKALYTVEKGQEVADYCRLGRTATEKAMYVIPKKMNGSPVCVILRDPKPRYFSLLTCISGFCFFKNPKVVTVTSRTTRKCHCYLEGRGIIGAQGTLAAIALARLKMLKVSLILVQCSRQGGCPADRPRKTFSCDTVSGPD